VQGVHPVLTVGVDDAVVESDLRAGVLVCPVAGCGGWLAPWGWARKRVVRGLVEPLRPRRSRCASAAGCGATHVLLPASVLLRRADAVDVIGAGLLAAAGGLGHRRVAEEVERPVSTVRGWLARTVRVADRVLAVCGVVAAGFGVEFVPPAPVTGPVAAVVEMLGALGRAAGRRLGGSRSPWRLAALVTGGRLLAPGGPDLVVAVRDPINTTSRLGGRVRSR
jgi:hypothetical protein